MILGVSRADRDNREPGMLNDVGDRGANRCVRGEHRTDEGSRAWAETHEWREGCGVITILFKANVHRASSFPGGNAIYHDIIDNSNRPDINEARIILDGGELFRGDIRSRPTKSLSGAAISAEGGFKDSGYTEVSDFEDRCVISEEEIFRFQVSMSDAH